MCDNKVKIKFLSECSTDEVRKFKELVKIGGQVEDIERYFSILAYKVCFIENNGDFIAVGAIKKKKPQKIATIFSNANVSDDSVHYQYELGWIVVAEKCRGKGLATKIIEKLMQELGSGNCYATTRTTNKAMENILLQNKFEKLGTPYKSERGNYNLQLYGFKKE